MARAAAAFALVALVMCVALGTAMAEQKATWTDCTGPGAIGKIDNISINPNPLKIHGNTSIIGTGSITEAVRTHHHHHTNVLFPQLTSTTTTTPDR